jgi:putative SOS response-associated peptidase YedK
MCGRYASTRDADALAEEFEVVEQVLAAPIEPDWNVAPTKPVPAIVARPPRQPGGEDVGGVGGEGPQRQLRTLTWGLVPFWAKDPGIGSRMINARTETVAEKPAFRQAFARRRCLLPADGYFEWYPTHQLGKNGKPLKQPFFIRPHDGGVLAMAGLYEIWRDPDRADDDPERFRWTCTVLTTSATDELGHLHDRMPMTVARESWAAWLDPTREEDARGLLVPAAPGALTAYPVSTAVGNVRNNGPSLVEPLPLDDIDPEVARQATGEPG